MQISGPGVQQLKEKPDGMHISPGEVLCAVRAQQGARVYFLSRYPSYSVRLHSQKFARLLLQQLRDQSQHCNSCNPHTLTHYPRPRHR